MRPIYQKPKYPGWEDKERFIIIHDEGLYKSVYGRKLIMQDRETGVQYLVFTAEWGSMGGVIPLLSAEGKPIVTEIFEKPDPFIEKQVK